MRTYEKLVKLFGLSIGRAKELCEEANLHRDTVIRENILPDEIQPDHAIVLHNKGNLGVNNPDVEICAKIFAESEVKLIYSLNGQANIAAVHNGNELRNRFGEPISIQVFNDDNAEIHPAFLSFNTILDNQDEVDQFIYRVSDRPKIEQLVMSLHHNFLNEDWSGLTCSKLVLECKNRGIQTGNNWKPPRGVTELRVEYGSQQFLRSILGSMRGVEVLHAKNVTQGSTHTYLDLSGIRELYWDCPDSAITGRVSPVKASFMQENNHMLDEDFDFRLKELVVPAEVAKDEINTLKKLRKLTLIINKRDPKLLTESLLLLTELHQLEELRITGKGAVIDHGVQFEPFEHKIALPKLRCEHVDELNEFLAEIITDLHVDGRFNPATMSRLKNCKKLTVCSFERNRVLFEQPMPDSLNEITVVDYDERSWVKLHEKNQLCLCNVSCIQQQIYSQTIANLRSLDDTGVDFVIAELAGASMLTESYPSLMYKETDDAIRDPLLKELLWSRWCILSVQGKNEVWKARTRGHGEIAKTIYDWT